MTATNDHWSWGCLTCSARIPKIDVVDQKWAMCSTCGDYYIVESDCLRTPNALERRDFVSTQTRNANGLAQIKAEWIKRRAPKQP